MDKHWEEIREMKREYQAQEEQREHVWRPPPCNDATPRSSNPYHNIPTEHSPQHPPEGETPPLYWCRDRCKFFNSKHRLNLDKCYWGCANYSCDYPDRRWDTSRYWQLIKIDYSMFPYHLSFKVCTNNLSRLLVVPDLLCRYRKWINLEIYQHNQWTLDCEEWDNNRDHERREEERRTEEHNQRIRRETQAYKCREREAREREREKKREMAAEAKAADEEYNTVLARKGK
uniref:PH01B001G05.15 protein n=1 Tax=Phyllostachys edulis TaxID=38705 RepID=L0P2C3_PHYED|nr:PH01B001G05.15 [Phyllostachys edulis]